MKNSLKDDLKSPLDKVQRWWIRRPVVILFMLIILPVGAIDGAYNMASKFCRDCW